MGIFLNPFSFIFGNFSVIKIDLCESGWDAELLGRFSSETKNCFFSFHVTFSDIFSPLIFFCWYGLEWKL